MLEKLRTWLLAPLNEQTFRVGWFAQAPPALPTLALPIPIGSTKYNAIISRAYANVMPGDQRVLRNLMKLGPAGGKGCLGFFRAYRV